MNHSVQAYWERIPIDQLILFLENDLFTGAYAINDAILQDILYKLSIKWFNNHFIAPKVRRELYETGLCYFLI